MLAMDFLVSYVLKQQQSGAPSFDPRAARPKCKVCGKDAWMQWDGSYADFCSRGCRDTAAVSASRARGAPILRPPKYSKEDSRGGQPLAPRKSILRWEQQFSPSNRHLPGQEESEVFSSKTDFLVGAVAAKRAAQALKARARRGGPRRRSLQEKQGSLSALQQRVETLGASAISSSTAFPPFQKQRTVSRFTDGDVVKEEALREYQAALSRQHTREQRRRFSDLIRRRSKTSVVSSLPSSRPSFLTRDLEEKSASTGRASPEQCPRICSPHSEASTTHATAQPAQTLATSAEQVQSRSEGGDDAERFLLLENKVAEVQTLLEKQTEEQALLHRNIQELNALLDEKLKASVDSSVAEALKSSALLQTLKRKGDETAAAVRKSQELVLAQLEAQREDILKQYRHQGQSLESTRRRLERLEEEAAAGRAKLKQTESKQTESKQTESKQTESKQTEFKPSEFKQFRLSTDRGGDTRLLAGRSQRLQETWLQRKERLFQEAVAAAVSREEEVGPWMQPYEGMLRVESTNVALALRRDSSKQERLAFGSQLRVVVRCSCAKNCLEERRSEAFTDLRVQQIEFAFRVCWNSASAATAASACVEVQLWSDGQTKKAWDLLGAARLPLPFFAAPWTYTAPLCWDPEIGGQLDDECIFGGSSLDACLPSPLTHAAVTLTLHFLPDALEKRAVEERNVFAPSHRETGVTLATRLALKSNSPEETQELVEMEALSKSSSSSPPKPAAPQSECPLIENVLRRLKRLKDDLRSDGAAERGRAVAVNSGKLERHLRRQPGAPGLCTNSFCEEKVRSLPDLYSEEEFRVWGLCGTCQRLLFPTPIPQEPPSKVELRPPREVRVAKPDDARKGAENNRRREFSELRLDSLLPVAFPEPAFLWPSALQLLHAQRFADVRLQEQVRSCLDSAELVQLLRKTPELKLFERKDWDRRAAAALRTCLLLLVQQHPKLQLLLSSLRGSIIAYNNPLRNCILEQDAASDGEAPLPPNLAGHILMEICDGLAPPPYVNETTVWRRHDSRKSDEIAT